VVHGGRCKEERLYEHGNAREDGRHTIDTLSPIAVRVSESGTLRNQLVYIRGIALILSSLQSLVESTDIFASEALDNQHHHILSGKTRINSQTRSARMMHRTIYGLHLLRIVEILRYDKHILTDRTIE
jgi:hypothetical protein